MISKDQISIRSKSEISIDYKKAFDSSDHYIKTGVKEYVKFLICKEIREKGYYKDFQEYFQKFTQQVNDTSLINYFKKVFFDINSPSIKNGSMLDHNMQIITWTDLVENNGDSLIYIDFWASWCFPCREAMPDLEKLSNKFKNKPIKILRKKYTY